MERIVFISYSSQDKLIADAICRQLLIADSGPVQRAVAIFH